ncbi:MAG: hypothetical protein H7Y36_06050 [Armatimonadetes bacterium]|nr:hypothetical protein [Akkermansiaceae bacterium]
MNPTPPLICGMLLVAMMSAGMMHFWSVQNYVAEYPPEQVIRKVPDRGNPAKTKTLSPKTATRPAPLATYKPSRESKAQKEFFEGLVSEMKKLRTENRDLLDQLAETNRDVMKLEFRVDTHSESFRPLPTSEDREDTSFGIPEEDLQGVLPPRASPVYPVEN